MTPTDLSPDQRTVFDAMLDWTANASTRRERPILTVGGLAGTGKTTLLGVLAAELQARKKLVAYATFTGRAASVLQRKLRAGGVVTTSETRTRKEAKEVGRVGGPPLCTTIHGLLYRPVTDPVTEEIRGWEKRTELDRAYDLVVIDEASMVSDEILEDISRHGVPLLAVGDHGQLPPVAARGDLMQNPTLRLEKIHRQAEGSPIIALAHHIRSGGRFSNFKGHRDTAADAQAAIRFFPKDRLSAVITDAFAEAAVVTDASAALNVGLLCWTNAVRVEMNRKARGILGHKSFPQAGEIVVCCKNRPPVYNGMRGHLTAPAAKGSKPWRTLLRVRFPDEEISDVADALTVQFNRARPIQSIEELAALGVHVDTMGQAGALYDFGYAMSVHKSQGSQFDHAILYCDRPEEPHKEDSRRFFYTAVTRAARRLTVVR